MPVVARLVAPIPQVFQVAFQMIEEVNFGNVGRASTFATLLFVAILPVMIYNIRNMQKAK